MRLKGVPKNYPIQQDIVSCACGCGAQIERYYLSDQHWHERYYVHNHHRNGKKQSDKQKQAVRSAMKNWKITHKDVVEKRRQNQRWIDSVYNKKAITTRWANTRRVITYWFCAWCGKPFKKNWSAIKNPNLTFCCNDHKYNYFSGNNHFLYKGGLKQYPREWTAKLRSRIKVRDGRICVVCHTQDYRRLVVHHIDENKMNCNLENLVTLCRSCHQKIHVGSATLSESKTTNVSNRRHPQT